MTRWLVFFLLLYLLFPLPSLGFTPHYLLNDAEFEDSTAWILPEIRNFLETKGSPLATYAPRDVDGSLKKAADIIAIAGRKHRVNPKVLLVLLQKEQSLVEDSSVALRQAQGIRRLDWATGYGVCDDCRKSDPRLAGFRGFTKQVDFAAARLRYFFDHPNEFRIQKGRPARIDRQRVTPLTRATAALYLYTPHIHGNQNFWIIWNRWFEQRYPDGAVLKNKKTQDHWVIANGRKRRILSSLALNHFQQRTILSVEPDELLKYREGKLLTTAPFGIVRTPDDTVWLLGIDERRRIANADVLRTLGYNPEEIELVPDSALKDYRDGPSIEDALGASTIRLIKTPSTSTVYLIDRAQKRPFISAEVFERLGYQWNHVLTLAADIANQYPTGAPIEFTSDTEAQQALQELKKENL